MRLEAVRTSSIPYRPEPAAAMKLAVAAHLLLACLVPVGATALRASEVAARAWLRNHPARAESEDELAELNTENPDAYAIVKSLLMKKSLGLLDPKHPSASFAKTPTSDSAAEETIAPVESESAVTMPSPDGSATAASSEGTHKDWLNWKPQDSAANDEAMVHSVLGAVAQIKGGQSTDAVQGAPQSSATRDTSASLEWKDPSSDTMPAAEPPVVPVAQPAAEAPEPAKIGRASCRERV